jgi:hypothetical protein
MYQKKISLSTKPAPLPGSLTGPQELHMTHLTGGPSDPLSLGREDHPQTLAGCTETNRSALQQRHPGGTQLHLPGCQIQGQVVQEVRNHPNYHLPAHLETRHFKDQFLLPYPHEVK